MSNNWHPSETSTHQDHVIAHVVGATVCGYFVFDEALYLLLDIGFIWIVFLDGEMGLLPHPVAVGELEMDEQARSEIKADVETLLSDSPVKGISLMKLPPLKPDTECQIKDVRFFADGERRRLLLVGEEANLAIETSLSTGEVSFYES
jgi:hypothetical protein